MERSRGSRSESSRTSPAQTTTITCSSATSTATRSRSGSRGSFATVGPAEVAFEVADDVQGRGIGTILTRELAADARAAGITELHATVCGDNPRAVSLLARISHSLNERWRGGERELVARLGS